MNRFQLRLKEKRNTQQPLLTAVVTYLELLHCCNVVVLHCYTAVLMHWCTATNDVSANYKTWAERSNLFNPSKNFGT